MRGHLQVRTPTTFRLLKFFAFHVQFEVLVISPLKCCMGWNWDIWRTTCFTKALSDLKISKEGLSQTVMLLVMAKEKTFSAGSFWFWNLLPRKNYLASFLSAFQKCHRPVFQAGFGFYAVEVQLGWNGNLLIFPISPSSPFLPLYFFFVFLNVRLVQAFPPSPPIFIVFTFYTVVHWVDGTLVVQNMKHSSTLINNDQDI